MRKKTVCKVGTIRLWRCGLTCQKTPGQSVPQFILCDVVHTNSQSRRKLAKSQDINHHTLGIVGSFVPLCGSRRFLCVEKYTCVPLFPVMYVHMAWMPRIVPSLIVVTYYVHNILLKCFFWCANSNSSYDQVNLGAVARH